MQQVLNFTLDNWLIISPVLIAIALRIWPTEKDYDVIGLIFRVLDKIIPNVRKKVRSVAVLLFMLSFMSLSLELNAQLNGNFKTVRLSNVTDSTTVLDIDGSIYYNTQSNKFRVRENGVWKDLSRAGNPGSFWTTNADVTLSAQVKVFTNGFSLREGTDDVHFFVNNNMTQMKTSKISTSQTERYLIEMNRLSGVGIKIADNIDFQGLRYEADYSANLGVSDLIVPNWGAVKNLLIAGSRIDLGAVVSNQRSISSYPHNTDFITTGTGTTLTTALGNNGKVLVINVASAFTVNLPNATAPFTVVVKDGSGAAATNNITITPDGTDLIDGAANYVINTNYGSVTLVYSGTDWYIID